MRRQCRGDQPRRRRDDGKRDDQDDRRERLAPGRDRICIPIPYRRQRHDRPPKAVRKGGEVLRLNLRFKMPNADRGEEQHDADGGRQQRELVPNRMQCRPKPGRRAPKPGELEQGQKAEQPQHPNGEQFVPAGEDQEPRHPSEQVDDAIEAEGVTPAAKVEPQRILRREQDRQRDLEAVEPHAKGAVPHIRREGDGERRKDDQRRRRQVETAKGYRVVRGWSWHAFTFWGAFGGKAFCLPYAPNRRVLCVIQRGKRAGAHLRARPQLLRNCWPTGSLSLTTSARSTQGR